MSFDRFVRWGTPPEWGAPTIERLAAVARSFLGERWLVTVEGNVWITCECDDPQTVALEPERPEMKGCRDGTRYFEVFHCTGLDGHTSVITRQSDEFTGALADRYAAIVARWWNGTVEKGG
jgi:hypothetical protein